MSSIESKFVSETYATKRMGVKDNKSFYQTFVTKQHLIQPVIKPGRKRREYLKEEVEKLPEILKKITAFGSH